MGLLFFFLLLMHCVCISPPIDILIHYLVIFSSGFSPSLAIACCFSSYYRTACRALWVAGFQQQQPSSFSLLQHHRWNPFIHFIIINTTTIASLLLPNLSLIKTHPGIEEMIHTHLCGLMKLIQDSALTRDRFLVDQTPSIIDHIRTSWGEFHIHLNLGASISL